ncbi:hypothetical protein PSTT_07158 [Puccinia striiformis]|uniref:Uncharacterized protein n=1 Tax=Puccinia striiformis TaxID=27350 RepID=A0A2S4VHM9_9BASI|nr:hypothetical protein PSTT_07158 [Puccinia striiformis]
MKNYPPDTRGSTARPQESGRTHIDIDKQPNYSIRPPRSHFKYRQRLHMVPSTHIGRRKIARSSHPEYQNSLTATPSTPAPSLLQSATPGWRLLLVDSGPWFLELGPVLERRDEDRHRLWKRQKNKRLKRRASLAQSEDPNRPKTKNPQQAEEEAGDNHLFSPKTHNRPKKKNPQQAEEEAGDIHLLSPKTHNRPKKKNPQQAEEEAGDIHLLSPKTHNRPKKKKKKKRPKKETHNRPKKKRETFHLLSPNHNRPRKKNPQQAEEEDIPCTNPGREEEPTTGREEGAITRSVRRPATGEEEEGDMTIASAVVMPSGPSTIPTNNTLEAPSRALTPDLPSSVIYARLNCGNVTIADVDFHEQDLLRSIHHESISFYGSHNVISIPTASRGPRPKKWEEPVAMTRALDGSALMAIEIVFEKAIGTNDSLIRDSTITIGQDLSIRVLLEEITKDLIENGLSSANPRINAE